MSRRYPVLSPRQQEVLALIGQGLSDEVIAHRLAITLNTARVYVDEVVALIRQRGRVERGDDDWPLTRREAQVLALLRDALTDREISARLGVSLRTAEDHTLRVLKKLGKRSRRDLKWS